MTDQVDVRIKETPVVALDRELYGLSRQTYDRILDNLRMDPFLGVSMNGIHYEYILPYDGLWVRYIVHVDRMGICVHLTGIRPSHTISKSERVVENARRVLSVVKKIKNLVDLFGIGK